MSVIVSIVGTSIQLFDWRFFYRYFSLKNFFNFVCLNSSK
ncbi:hypothetical protein HMPREF9498_02733 [Enterococcus faecalis TX4248]|uniref:Uncharacterized protein n=1 Tax=Enterococcus faecalis TX4248 TaxID=749495 RepID=A0A125W2Q9_ENTFL|nr:hypothetical protein HMPREF9498_02733 [Enterococcus faecalis TX4248]